MRNNKSVKEYAKLQYDSHENLTKRMNLWSYGSNPETFPKWVFSHINLQENERVLELGGGTGQLWIENYKKIPSTCSIMLSDFSQKMLDKAKENLEPLNLSLKFKIIDAEKIPYGNNNFDVVIGCHMLYHIPNIEKALTEISRVLKPSGRFISTTISKNHIKELKDFLSKFGLYSDEKFKLFSEFRNETGRNVLKPFFEEILFKEYLNYVKITSVTPLINYIDSMSPKERYPNYLKIKPQIENAIKQILKEKSKFEITGISGIFISKKPMII
jgi:ubiquinone/menaquinone biosynthesis C-methylase UbiE